jgi:threonylcarbamoyladenosine tRNA methylthiotransferase MtaB
MKVKFYTLGCKVNQYDTQSIRERFLEHGFKEARAKEQADFCLINTCTVTSSADSKSRNAISSAIRENPGAKVVVTGCMAKDAEKSLRAIKGISLAVSKSFFNEGVSGFSGHTRAFLKVQDGCDNFCSYCKVPLVRGRSRSRSLEEIIKDARALAGNGFKEIVLTGICLGAYGRDLTPEKDLVSVIDALEDIPGILRIRLSSIEAGDVSERLVRKMAVSSKLCPHLHIPVQSGDDGVLKKMRRCYSSRDYLELVRKLKKKVPGIAITTDCLVGFPAETEGAFRNTLSLVKKIMPLKVHIFPYSARKGTHSAKNFSTNVPAVIVKERVKRLARLADDCAKECRKRLLGDKSAVLFECLSSEKKGYWEGYTGNYIKVFRKSRNSLKNKLLSV